MKHQLSFQKGFTLVELMIAVGILVFVLINMMVLFIYSSAQSQMAGNVTLAVSQAQNKIEEIRNDTFSNIVADYSSGGTPGNIFNLTGLTGKGTVYIDSSNAELLKITVVINWQDKYGRVIGEDKNLNGVLDAGEDTNGNGQLDSPVELISMITRR